MKLKKKTIAKIHAYIGLVSAVFIAVLAITGILLQHTESFKLDSRYVKSALLLKQYGVKPQPISSYKTKEHWVSYAGDTIYINTQAVAGHYSQLLGAIDVESGFVIITTNAVVLLSAQGELLDSLTPGDGLPESMQAIAYNQQKQPVLKGEQFIWQTDNDFLSWKKTDGSLVNWVAPLAAPQDIHQILLQQSRENIISWEKFILDIHSGRFLGPVGVFIMDMAAIAMLLLACGGIYMFIKNQKSREKS